MRKIIFLLVSALTSVAAPAQAAKQTPSAPLSATTPATPANNVAGPAVPTHKCQRPDELGKLASNTQQKIFVKEMDGYRDCLMAYRNDMNLLAKAHVEAANAAVEEFNNYIATINKK